ASGMWNYCFFQFYRNFAGPYWVERQYNPQDPSFIPRAGSMLSLNLTHRNWLGIRGPNTPSFGLIDPAGALSPVIGYYSIEVALWKAGKIYLPARGQVKVEQELNSDLPIPVTTYSRDDIRVTWKVAGSPMEDGTILNLVEWEAGSPGWEIIIGVRPFNPEGAALIQDLKYSPEKGGGIVVINGKEEVALLDAPDLVVCSSLERGDAYFNRTMVGEINCPYGIATGAFHYRLKGKGRIRFHARTYEQVLPPELEFENRSALRKARAPQLDDIRKEGERMREKLIVQDDFPLSSRFRSEGVLESELQESQLQWSKRMEPGAVFQSARELWNRAAAINKGFVLSLQTGTKITPGVFTYRQFWFRDAAYMLSALAGWNFLKQARIVLETYPDRQEKDGFFRSHEGEWDSNGQAIWTLAHFARMTGDRDLLKQSYDSIQRGVEWIKKKRRRGYQKRLMPPGFSAEHLGPADHYYWDNLWSIGGLREAAYVAETLGRMQERQQYLKEENAYRSDFLTLSLEDRQKYGVLTAAPSRPIDSGMIGSICMLYPLDLHILPEAEEKRTVMTIYRDFFLRGLFFHPIIHSGFNIYLSLQMAQCLLRLNEVKEARRVLKRVLQSRTQLWTYPEAIHPNTGGGVMGDGFHGWAAAELLILLREFVVADRGTHLRLFTGLKRKELIGAPIRFGPFPMYGGHITISGNLEKNEGELLIEFPGLLQSGLEFLELHLGPLNLKSAHFKVDGAEHEEQGYGLRLRPEADRIRIRY
ncbi:MAG: hypothetical protein KDK37_15410, partial [Leptospiraceae bacterium]|nr:hypothetical protein [Leptospiraceae bacterium]